MYLTLTEWAKNFLAENGSFKTKAKVYDKVYDFAGNEHPLLEYKLDNKKKVREVAQIQMADTIFLALQYSTGEYIDKAGWNMVFTGDDIGEMENGY